MVNGCKVLGWVYCFRGERIWSREGNGCRDRVVRLCRRGTQRDVGWETPWTIEWPSERMTPWSCNRDVTCLSTSNIKGVLMSTVMVVNRWNYSAYMVKCCLHIGSRTLWQVIGDKHWRLIAAVRFLEHSRGNILLVPHHIRNLSSVTHSIRAFVAHSIITSVTNTKETSVTHIIRTSATPHHYETKVTWVGPRWWRTDVFISTKMSSFSCILK